MAPTPLATLLFVTHKRVPHQLVICIVVGPHHVLLNKTDFFLICKLQVSTQNNWLVPGLFCIDSSQRSIHYKFGKWKSDRNFLERKTSNTIWRDSIEFEAQWRRWSKVILFQQIKFDHITQMITIIATIYNYHYFITLRACTH